MAAIFSIGNPVETMYSILGSNNSQNSSHFSQEISEYRTSFSFAESSNGYTPNNEVNTKTPRQKISLDFKLILDFFELSMASSFSSFGSDSNEVDDSQVEQLSSSVYLVSLISSGLIVLVFLYFHASQSKVCCLLISSSESSSSNSMGILEANSKSASFNCNIGLPALFEVKKSKQFSSLISLWAIPRL